MFRTGIYLAMLLNHMAAVAVNDNDQNVRFISLDEHQPHPGEHMAQLNLRGNDAVGGGTMTPEGCG